QRYESSNSLKFWQSITFNSQSDIRRCARNWPAPSVIIFFPDAAATSQYQAGFAACRRFRGKTTLRHRPTPPEPENHEGDVRAPPEPLLQSNAAASSDHKRSFPQSFLQSTPVPLSLS